MPILTNLNPREAHNSFIEWLNTMNENYISGFYDTAIQNLIGASFIKSHRSTLQEMYSKGGSVIDDFVTLLPTDTTNHILMIHDLETGVPYLYNDTNTTEIFRFDNDGNFSGFIENVTIDLIDSKGEVKAEMFFSLTLLYGIYVPLLHLKLEDRDLFGWLDVDFDGRGSGSYLVNNSPLDDLDKYLVINKGSNRLSLSVPIFGEFIVDFDINVNASITLPVTSTVTYYLEEVAKLNNLEYKII